MRTDLNTPAALENYLGARRDLLESMRADQRNGASANDLARLVQTAWSRPTTLDFLKVLALRDEVRALIEQAGLKPYVDVSTPAAATAPREVRLLVACDPLETPPEIWGGLPARIEGLLVGAGVAWVFPDDEDLPLAALLDEQEYVQLRRG
ncbi:hypothetical protein [Kitasatospora purpeofusca]|uniref:hypothetical protein n=1 Tax=Kitasatospora purpeofusca TaxID=67352 RepID=UPI0035DDA32C